MEPNNEPLEDKFKKWNKPNLIILDKKETKSGFPTGYAEDNNYAPGS